MQDALAELVNNAQDELTGQNLFEGHKAEGDRTALLQQKIDRWQQVLSRLE